MKIAPWILFVCGLFLMGVSAMAWPPEPGAAGFWADDPWDEGEKAPELTEPDPVELSEECSFAVKRLVGATYQLQPQISLQAEVEEDQVKPVVGAGAPSRQQVGRLLGSVNWYKFFKSSWEIVNTNYEPARLQSQYLQQYYGIRQEFTWLWPVSLELRYGLTNKVFPTAIYDSLATEREATLRWSKRSGTKTLYSLVMILSHIDKEFPRLTSWSYLKEAGELRFTWRPGAWYVHLQGTGWTTTYPWSERQLSGRKDWRGEVRGPILPHLELLLKGRQDYRTYPEQPRYDYDLDEWEVSGRYCFRHNQALTLGTRKKSQIFHNSADKLKNVVEHFWLLRWELQSPNYSIYLKWEAGERWRPEAAPPIPNQVQLYQMEFRQSY